MSGAHGTTEERSAAAAPELRSLQRELQHYLMGEDTAIAGAIVDAPPLATAARLGIYHNAYRVRLVEALHDTYPKLHAVLGDEVFAALGEEFITAFPSVHRSIRWYGRELAQLLATRAPFAGQPILAELATLEWTLAEVFDSPDAPAAERTALSAIDPAAWSELKLDLHPSLRWLDLEWNSVAVWQAMSAEEPAPEPRAAEHPVPWLLWRRNLNNYFRSLPADELAALAAARAGSSFAGICEALATYLPEGEIPLRAAGLIGGWADSGIIASIRQP